MSEANKASAFEAIETLYSKYNIKGVNSSSIANLKGFLSACSNLKQAFTKTFDKLISELEKLDKQITNSSNLFTDDESKQKAIINGVGSAVPTEIKEWFKCLELEPKTIDEYKLAFSSMNLNQDIVKLANNNKHILLYKEGANKILKYKYSKLTSLWRCTDSMYIYISATLPVFLRHLDEVSKYSESAMFICQTLDNYVKKTIPDKLKSMISEFNDSFLHSGYYKVHHVPDKQTAEFRILIDALDRMQASPITESAVSIIETNLALYRERETQATLKFTETINAYKQELADKNKQLADKDRKIKAITASRDQWQKWHNELEDRLKKTLAEPSSSSYNANRASEPNVVIVNNPAPIVTAPKTKPIPELKTSYDNGRGTTFGAGIGPQGWNTGFSHSFGNGWSISGGFGGCW